MDRSSFFVSSSPFLCLSCHVFVSLIWLPHYILSPSLSFSFSLFLSYLPLPSPLMSFILFLFSSNRLLFLAGSGEMLVPLSDGLLHYLLLYPMMNFCAVPGELAHDGMGQVKAWDIVGVFIQWK